MAEVSTPLQGVPKHLSGPSRWRRAWHQLPFVLVSMPLLLFFLLPLLALVLRVSPADLLSNVVDPAVAQAIQLSLVTTLITVGLTLLTGTPVAYLLARRRFPGRIILDTLVDLPMLLPPSVAGIALLVALGRRGLLGPALESIGVELPFTPAAVVLAQTFVASPFYVKAAMTAFARVDQEIEHAAALDGASSFGVFRFITLPLALPVLLSGIIMTWARALGEFGATIIFAGDFPGRTETMPIAIYIGFDIDLRLALTLAVILLVTSCALLFLVKGVLQQRVDLERSTT